MKKILLYSLALFLLPLVTMAQDELAFVIKSKVGNWNYPARAYLIYVLGANQVVDSAEVANGKFEFSGKVFNPSPAIIVMDPLGQGLSKLTPSSDNINFYIDKGEIDITATDSIAKAQITGSPINDDNKKLMAQLEPINEQAKKLKAQEKAASKTQQNTPEFQNAMDAKFKDLQNAQKGILKVYILANPDSYLSLLALRSVGGPAPDPSELDPLYDALSPRLKGMEAAKVFKKSLDGLRATALGVLAPDFTQADVNGVPVKLSSFRGKYVLIDFWASWCGPCRQENPNVVKAYNKYKDKNFTILGVSLDRPDGRAAWIAAIKNDGLGWTQVSDLKFWKNEVAQLYLVNSIPANFLISPDGKIVAKNLRGSDLENKLEELFGK